MEIEGNCEIFAASTKRKYLIAHPEMKANQEMGNQITEMLKGMGFGDVKKSDNYNFRCAVMWLNSVFSFYELGLQKEKKGLGPKIHISW